MRLRVGTRRSGAIFSAITSLVFYGVWAVVAFGVVAWFSDRDNAGSFVPALSSGLLFVMLYWQLAPIISAGFGASLDLKKLLVYPIPHEKLFVVEVLLRLSSCAEMLLLVGGVAIGLMRNPLYGVAAAPLIIVGVLLFTVTNLLLSAGIRQAVERLFLRTRMREAMMLLVFVAAVIPQLFLLMRIRESTLLKIAPEHVIWPWSAAANLILGTKLLAAIGLSLAYVALAWWFGRWQFERGIRYDGGQQKEHVREDRANGFGDALFRLPFRWFRDPVAALIEKELRTLMRIPRFRTVFVMSCVFGIVIYLPTLRSRNPHSFVFQNALPFMALYGLLMLGPISYWNAFGFDRSAVEGYFSWPIRFRDALIAKNVTIAILLIPQIAMISIVARAARMPVTAGKLAETIIVILIAALYWFGMGNIWSVRMPRAMDPEKMNQMANKIQALSIWTAPLLLLPIALAYWARAVFENEFVFAGVLAIAGVVGGVFYWVGLDSAVRTAVEKREAMLMQLAKSDGPLSMG
jgi:ABC-2 type transport system permease protein